MLLLDSNILISYLNGNELVISKLNEFKSKDIVLCISVITVTEVLALTTLTQTEIKNIDSSS